VLLDAGLPLPEAIQALAERERRGDVRALLEQLGGALREGQPLSASLKRFPRAFAPAYVATVQAAETTGDVGPALARYAAYQKQVDALRKRVAAASIYPTLLLAAGGLVTLFLLLYVVPRFSAIFEERGAARPGFSSLLQAGGGFVAGLLAAAAVAAIYALSRPAVRAALEDALWRVPAIGEHLRVYQLARFYRTVGMLLQSGVPLVGALQLGGALLRPAMRQRLDGAVRAIREGRPVAASLEAGKLTTPVAARLLAVGEKAGRMGEMMERVATFHDEEIARWVDWAMRLFEPLLMAAIGLAVGAIVVLMYMPIFELAGNIR
jgi:general secretion pathway protein F